ncbi:MAG: adenine phosphoribosyltransferase [Oscillospiraceae bacterium]|nr:adenine phosphoribosyltransferase [Oscillospiraceae bacterium]
MAEFYEMQIAGCTRKLRKCSIHENLQIGAFIMFSDVEITVKSAAKLLEKAPEFDVLLTAECKGIPLAYEMARQSGKNYIVARKSVKLYMQDVVSVNVKSITTEAQQVLYLDGEKAELLRNQRVLIIDDVISTGESLRALEYLVQKAGGIVAGKAAVLAEGDAADRKDLIYLEKLPLFFGETEQTTEKTVT